MGFSVSHIFIMKAPKPDTQEIPPSCCTAADIRAPRRSYPSRQASCTDPASFAFSPMCPMRMTFPARTSKQPEIITLYFVLHRRKNRLVRQALRNLDDRNRIGVTGLQIQVQACLRDCLLLSPPRFWHGARVSLYPPSTLSTAARSPTISLIGMVYGNHLSS